MSSKATAILIAIVVALSAPPVLQGRAAGGVSKAMLPAVLLNGTGYMLPDGRLLVISGSHVVVAALHGPGLVLNATSILKLPGRLEHNVPPAILVNNSVIYVALYTEKGSIVAQYSHGRWKLLENPSVSGTRLFTGVKPCFATDGATAMLALCSIRDGAPRFRLAPAQQGGGAGEIVLVQSALTPLKPVAPNYGFNASKRLLAAPRRVYSGVKEVVPGLLYNVTGEKGQRMLVWFTAAEPWSPRIVRGNSVAASAGPYTLCTANGTGVSLYYAWSPKPLYFSYDELGVSPRDAGKLVLKATPLGCLIKTPEGVELLATGKGVSRLNGILAASAACIFNTTLLPGWLQETIKTGTSSMPVGPYYAEAVELGNVSLLCVNGTGLLLPGWMGVPLLAGSQGVGVISVEPGPHGRVKTLLHPLEGRPERLEVQGLPLSYGLLDGRPFIFNGTVVKGETAAVLAGAAAEAMAGRAKLSIYPGLGLAAAVNKTSLILINMSKHGKPVVAHITGQGIARAPPIVTLCSNGSIIVWIPGAKVFYTLTGSSLIPHEAGGPLRAVDPASCRPVTSEGAAVVTLPAGGNTSLEASEARASRILVVGQAAAASLTLRDGKWVEYWHAAWREPGPGRAEYANAAPLDPLRLVGLRDGMLVALGPHGGVYAADAAGAQGATWWRLYRCLGGIVAIGREPVWSPGLKLLYAAAGVATPCYTSTKILRVSVTRTVTTTVTKTTRAVETTSVTTTTTVTRTVAETTRTVTSTTTKFYTSIRTTTVTVTKAGRLALISPLLSFSMLLTVALLAAALILIRRR